MVFLPDGWYPRSTVYFRMRDAVSVAIPASIGAEMCDHLIRADKQEDVLFALWYPSYGDTRFTALIHKPVYPEDGDRQRHGNASFNPQYLERVSSIALKEQAGIAFMHSHPVPGWQGMSLDDIGAEQNMMGAVYGLTNLPLLGMTVGSDSTWSARMWVHIKGKEYQRIWCNSVRTVGKNLAVSFNDQLIPIPLFQDEVKRTINVWGAAKHAVLSRLKIGIVGLGSVGSFVAELLVRMGCSNLVLIDFDKIKKHNLDRTLSATIEDIGRLKVEIIKDVITKSATSSDVQITTVPFSIAEKEGYSAALDCDVIFSCVDRPRARRILNHFAYAHLIPVIDGGIQVRFKKMKFSGVDWQLQTISPGRPCMECLGVYDNADVSTEIEGKLDDPSYIKGLPKNHRFTQNENVIPFSANLASLEVLHLLTLISDAASCIDDFGIQRFRYVPGILDQDFERKCVNGCIHNRLIASGDKAFSLFGTDCSAVKSRAGY